ncbi:MAG TPA: hypothetical protein PLA94_15195 [Myxococcota bacterium]|nr:hypothetical protein [Myxococcota bacterium]HND31346.1 hypothetical protein [Myxococcota bacterium]
MPPAFTARRGLLNPLRPPNFVLRDTLQVALDKEAALRKLLAEGKKVGYSIDTPTEAEQAAGLFNCTTFIVEVLEEAGYPVDRRLQAGGVQARLRDFINIEADDSEHLVLPELHAAASSQKKALLTALVDQGDPRITGVVIGLVTLHLGREIQSREALRPGDLLQTWTRVGSGSWRGHCTQVREVQAKNVHGDYVILDETTTPREEVLTDLLLRQHGSHLPLGRSFSDADKNDDILGLSVYTRDLVSLPTQCGKGDELHWYAVRPAGSDWPL